MCPQRMQLGLGSEGERAAENISFAKYICGRGLSAQLARKDIKVKKSSMRRGKSKSQASQKSTLTLTSNAAMAESSNWARLQKNELYEGGKWEPLKLFDKGRDILIAIPWWKLIFEFVLLKIEV